MTAHAAQHLTLLADRLRGLSALGLRFAENPHDRERYTAVQAMALELFAMASGGAAAGIEPLPASVFSHPTPFATADAAVLDENGRMLLIRRSDNGLWAMPGGASEVGETPAQTAVRETLEETGVACEPVALGGLFDSRRCGSISSHHLYQAVFICRTTGVPARVPTHADEALEIGWFREGDLPSDLDPGHATRIPVTFAVSRAERSAYFDRS